MPKDAIFEKEGRKVIFDSFVRMQFSLFDWKKQFLEKVTILMHFSKMFIIKYKLDKIEKNWAHIWNQPAPIYIK